MIDHLAYGRRVAGATLACLVVGAMASGCAHLPGLGRGTISKAAASPSASTTTRAAHEPETSTPNSAGELREAREQTALNPGEPYWHTAIARILLASDSTTAAEAELRAARGCDPTYAPALALTSSLWYRQRRHAEAIALLDPLRQAPTSGVAPHATLMAGLALHYEAIDRLDLAGAVLLELGPDGHRQAGSAAVYVAMRSERPESATDLAHAAAGRESRSAVNQNNLGIALLRVGDPKAARKAFLSAIDRDPERAGPYYNLAILERFYALDNVAGAKWFAEYRRRAQDDPDRLASIFGRADSGKDLVGQEEQR